MFFRVNRINWQDWQCFLINSFSTTLLFVERQFFSYYWDIVCTYCVHIYTLKKRVLQWFFRMVKGSIWNLFLSESGYVIAKLYSLVKNPNRFFIFCEKPQKVLHLFTAKTLKCYSSIPPWRTLKGSSQMKK